MTSTYYLAWNDIAFTNNSGYDKHLYFVKDTDGSLLTTTDQLIIRGTAQHNQFLDIVFGQTGALWVDESGKESDQSRDGLDNTGDNDGDGFLNNDKDEDGFADTPEDRHYTAVVLTDEQWNAMVQFAASPHTAAYDYDLLGANCQAVVVSALSSVGIDFEDNVPDDSSFNEYTSRNILLSGAGSDVLRGFSGDDIIFDKFGGDDIFYGGDDTNDVRHDVTDGVDTVWYADAAGTGTLEVYDDSRVMLDESGAGGFSDTLYSIEKVRFENYTNDNHDFNDMRKVA